jgi:hypothetical protein
MGIAPRNNFLVSIETRLSMDAGAVPSCGLCCRHVWPLPLFQAFCQHIRARSEILGPSCGIGGGLELPQPRLSVRGFLKHSVMAWLFYLQNLNPILHVHAKTEHSSSLRRWLSFRRQDGLRERQGNGPPGLPLWAGRSLWICRMLRVSGESGLEPHGHLAPLAY